jgi:DNA-binding response OmpR family regulator
MVALLVVFTFIAAILIDALVRRVSKVERPAEVRVSHQPAVAPAAAKSAPNVLVVDDEKTVCNSCRKILTQKGYNVDVASSGEEAIGKAKGNGFDVLIADWKMPQIDGIELARRIKKENPGIAVILITGYPSVETSIQAMRSGISDYVPKPFTPDELSDAMMRALAKGQAVPANLVLDRLAEKGMVDRSSKHGAAGAAQEAPRRSAAGSRLEERTAHLDYVGLSRQESRTEEK